MNAARKQRLILVVSILVGLATVSYTHLTLPTKA